MQPNAQAQHRRPYRPRRRRSGTPPPFLVTDRDVDIVRLIARYRFLHSDHIRRMVPGSDKNIASRLKALFEHGYLDRPECQYDPYRPGGGSRPLVYAVGKRGARLLADVDGSTVILHPSTAVGRPFLEHTLAIADFAVALRAAIADREAVELIDGPEMQSSFPAADQSRGRPFVMRVPVMHGGTPSPIAVEPDYAFSLSLPRVQRRASFLVEIDRGTMPIERQRLAQSSILKKLLGYHAASAAGLHTRQFGWKSFRVLFVTTSAARVDAMLAAMPAHPAIAGSPLFLFAGAASLYAGADVLTHPWRDGRGAAQQLLPAALLA